jgi:bifunctional DNase/RNase
MKCSTDLCSAEALVRVTIVRDRCLQAQDVLCDEHANLYWGSYLTDRRTAVGPDCNIPGAVCFELDLMRAKPSIQEETIALREVGGSRLVHFTVGYVEGCTIYYATVDTPYKHLFLSVIMANLITRFGGKLAYVIVDNYNEQGVLEAHAIIHHEEGRIELQIRPSDGLGLAIAVGIPFLIAEAVLAKIAETGKYSRADKRGREDKGDEKTAM